MTRWRCRSYRPLLVDHADGALSARQRDKLERHVAACAPCARDLAALREVPAQLQTSTVPDRGDEFWLQQRRAIARAVRNQPGPQSRWQPAWLRDGLHLGVWRYPLAVAASLLVALFVYRYAEQAQAPAPTPLAPHLAALDAESLAALHELVRAVAPEDEYLQPVTAADEALLAALPLADLVSVGTEPQVPGATDLSESELENVDTLLGGIG